MSESGPVPLHGRTKRATNGPPQKDHCIRRPHLHCQPPPLVGQLADSPRRMAAPPSLRHQQTTHCRQSEATRRCVDRTGLALIRPDLPIPHSRCLRAGCHWLNCRPCQAQETRRRRRPRHRNRQDHRRNQLARFRVAGGGDLPP